jgi:hypothetical protein
MRVISLSFYNNFSKSRSTDIFLLSRASIWVYNIIYSIRKGNIVGS